MSLNLLLSQYPVGSTIISDFTTTDILCLGEVSKNTREILRDQYKIYDRFSNIPKSFIDYNRLSTYMKEFDICMMGSDITTSIWPRLWDNKFWEGIMGGPMKTI